MIALQIDKVPITANNVEIYAWIIGVLILFIGALFTYFSLEKKALRQELKEERDFIKQESKANILMIGETNIILKQIVKLAEQNNINLQNVPRVVEDNNRRIEDIQNHLKNGH